MKPTELFYSFKTTIKIENIHSIHFRRQIPRKPGRKGAFRLAIFNEQGD